MVHGVHVPDQVHDLVGVAPLVVVPGHDLHEGIGEGDAGLGVEDGGVGIMQEIAGNHGVLGVIQDAFQIAFGGGLHGFADLGILGGLGQVHGQVDHGHVQGGNAHGHAGQLAVQLGDDLANGLGSAGGGGDDVARCSAAAAPVLHGRAVDGLLGGGDSVYSGHQAIGDAEIVMQDLGDGGQAVGGAGCVGDESHAGVVRLVVDAHDEHGGAVLGGGGHDDVLGAGVDVALGRLLGEEQAGGLYHILSAHLAPGQVGGDLLAENGDFAAVDDDGIVGVVHGALETAMHGVVFEHIGHVVGGEQVVDAHDFYVVMLQAGAENEAANAAESVDADLDHI